MRQVPYSETVAYVVGTNGVIFSSKDSGQTWMRQNSKQKEDLEAIDCIDKSTCWAVGRNGVILSTVNGGFDWDLYQYDDKLDLFAVSFASPKAGWAVGKKGSVLKTNDGGKTWEKIDESKLAGKSKADTKSLMFTAVKFFSEKSGCIAGDSRIFCTADGGKAWSYTETDESVYANKWLGFASSEHVLIAVGECAENDFVSSDKGKSWVRKTKKP